MKIRAMQLHTELFLAGTNYGNKLPGGKGAGLTMELSSWPEIGGETAIKITNKDGIFTYMPFANTVTCEPEQKTLNKVQINQHHDHIIAPIVKAQVGGPNEVLEQINNRANAQVESPNQKVQGKPGRKPKFQGEEVQGE